MSIQLLDGMMLKDMFLSAKALLEEKRASIDALNVFPVPDGDTGTNMTQTMVAAVKDIAQSNQVSVSDVASSVAKGALKGARGNSGVILSQILRGIAKGLEGHDTADAKTLVKAIRSGAEMAYKAVMRPKEGTILTVQRVIAEELERLSRLPEDIVEIMELVAQFGDAILKRTPDMLLPLKQAGVVDSGGKGLLTVYQGMLMALKGEAVGTPAPESAAPAISAAEFVDDHESIEDIKFGYCTEFIVSHPLPTVKESDVVKLRQRLEHIGDCVLVISDLEVIKVHVHTNEPGRALQMALELGEIDAIKIDNMLEEARERQAKKQAQQREEKEYGIVTVALGEGLSAIFRDLGVDCVVDGGQTMNPSIDDLYQAIESTCARNVFVLPNNSNIILAAQQAANISKKNVFVLPTKSVPMGIAAAIAFMPEASAEENEQAMKEAAEKVHTASITYAVRDTVFENRNIHQGDIMALVDNKISLLGRDVAEVTSSVVETMVNDDSEVISIYYGEEITEEQAQKLQQQLAAQYDMCDVNVYSGGQPLYYYLIAVE